MAHDIIMPALGMAQDTGLLVAWRKAPGDKVAVGETLFEVETDKATMEVEAAAEGYLSAVTAGAGEDVPVGQVIARIVSSEGEVDRTMPLGTATVAPAAPHPVAAALVVPPPPSPQPTAPNPPPPSTTPRPALVDARVLASPKARALAAEQGLDMARLARAGHPQPFHVADLDRLRGLAPSGRSTLGARIDGAALQALLKKATDADRGRVLAAFAKGAWRQVVGEDLAVTLMRADGHREGDGALLLVDLTTTRLTTYAPAEGLVLAAALDAGAVTLTLSFCEADLPFATAAAWLNETAARVEDPLRHLI